MSGRPEAGLMNLLNRQERAGAGLAAGSVLLVGGSVAASSLLGGYPVLGGQAIRYLVAGLLLAAWARLRRTPLPRPAGREWAWLAGLAVIGLAGCSVLLIEAGTSLLAAPVLPRLGPLAVTIYACGLAGILLLAAAVVASSAGGPPILRTPTATQLAALSYLTVAVTAVVFLTWYAAMKRLGVDRTGLFNGLIPIASLAAVALAGTGTITPLQCLAALTVLAGVLLGLGPAPQAPASTANQAGGPGVLPVPGAQRDPPAAVADIIVYLVSDATAPVSGAIVPAYRA